MSLHSESPLKFANQFTVVTAVASKETKINS